MKSKNLKKEGNIEDFYLIDTTSVLGEGASAIVRKGIKKETGEAFAIKIIDKMSLGEIESENLYNELKILSIVDHPNIVRVYEYYENNGIIFIVMEMMNGGELFEKLIEIDHYTESKASEIFREIVDAVRYCHSLGIVHRDLKAENLLFTTPDDDAVLKISDFGFAKYLIPNDGECLSTACGSPSYLAPEILEGVKYDKKVDCWSLGIILYIMLCGFAPFYAEDNTDLFNLIKKGEFEFHSPDWDNVSDNAKDLIKKLLILDPKKRLSCEEMLNHPWLNQSQYPNKELSFKEDYLEFKKKNKIKAAINAKLIINLWERITFNK
jgi:calcium/calmodulin-dependent protein kinase I